MFSYRTQKNYKGDFRTYVLRTLWQ